MAIIAKNVTGSPVFIEDLGIEIPANSQITLSDLFNESEIFDSRSLKDAINAGTIVLNDGIQDLSIQDALNYVGYQSEHEAIQMAETIHIGETPPQDPTEGYRWYKPSEHMLYLWNATLGNKWLSADRQLIVFSYNGKADGVFLPFARSKNSRITVYLWRPATILSMNILLSKSAGADKNFYLMDGNNVLKQLTIAAGSRSIRSTLNIDVDVDTELRVFVAGTGPSVRDPTVFIELCWRYV